MVLRSLPVDTGEMLPHRQLLVQTPEDLDWKAVNRQSLRISCIGSPLDTHQY